MSPAITVRNLGKRYRLGRGGPPDTFREALAHAIRACWPGVGRRPDREFWALRDVSFDVERGEAIGIVGRNGAGKTTLLKILSRITRLTTGAVRVYGRVGSLLEVGTGFHPELTGRENVYLNGAILGMKHAEIAARFDEIVAFAEVEAFIDEPVKRYSTGMQLRLAFAVAAHLQPEILLVDEVLAVGDVAFQKKCLGRMGHVAREGRTVVFVSHDLGVVSALCDRAVYLKGGRVEDIGPTAQIIARYLGDLSSGAGEDLSPLRLPGYGDRVRLVAVKLRSDDGVQVRLREPLRFVLTVTSTVSANDLCIGSSIFTQMGHCVGTTFSKQSFSVRAGETASLLLTISNVRLAPGTYYAGFSVGRGGYERDRLDVDIVIGRPEFRILPVESSGKLLAKWSAAWGHMLFDEATLERYE